ncbi:YaaC family protein [Tumebacillus lipolyticus]|uniref:YaaC family protein n=1 Tax=Tumebacillus lipolyticus TaxID=1280370 RepID=A0ABW4ZYE1_9BACL
MREKLLEATPKYVTPLENSKLPFEEFDYEKNQDLKRELTETWRNLKPEVQRDQYNKKIGNFYREKGYFDPTKEQNNFRLMWEEAEKRLQFDSGIKLLEINDHLQERAACDYLEMIENIDQIKSLYRFKKKSVGSTGLDANEAQIIKSCLRQGRELFESGRNSPMMVKPLIFFYSFTAYVYALIVMNNPLRYRLSMLNGSHGVNFVDSKSRIQFGGDITEGTFSDLFTSFSVINHVGNGVELLQDNRESIMAFWKSRYEISILELLSMIPELRDYYKLLTGENSRTHQLKVVRGQNHRAISWDIFIGDGHDLPSREDLESSFKDCEISRSEGKAKVSISNEKMQGIRGTIYSDIYGDFWYVENPLHPVVLPEICVHFLLMSSFSNIMRYNPYEWSRILENETDSKISLLIRRYISIFEHKLPILLMRGLTEFHAMLAKR